MRTRILTSLFFILYLSACTTEAQTHNCGVIVRKLYFFDSAGVPVFSADVKVWYKDSLAIEEITQTNINTDTNHKTTIKTEVLHYIYIDLRTKSFYKYKTMSDTSNIIKKHNQPDSAVRVDFFQDYFYTDRKIDFIAEPEVMQDTIIENVRYGRIKLKRDIGKGAFTAVIWTRCDKRGSKFSLCRYGSEKDSCPVVRSYSYDTGRQNPTTGAQIEFISDTLTKEELKIFGAWELNAKRNPVR